MEDVGKSIRHVDLSVGDELLHECQAMSRYAFASGLKVPGALMEGLTHYMVQEEKVFAGFSEEKGNMVSSGDRIPENPIIPHQGLNHHVRNLAMIHGQLSDIIAPATPRTVLLLANEEAKGSAWHFLGPVPLIRRMMFVAIISLIGLIIVSLSPDVDGHPDHFSLLHNSGFPLFLNEMFLLSAAAIGASFGALFQAKRYIQEGTFDPLYESSYWIRFVLGLLAGTMLGSLIPVESYADEGIKRATWQGFGQPLLALLGGFSAGAVHRILNRLTAAVEALVRGDTRDMLAAQEQAAKTRYAEKTLQHRMHLSTKLTKLQQLINSSANPKELQKELERIQGDLIMPGSYEDETETKLTPDSPEKKPA